MHKINKQNSSSSCFVCGIHNQHSLKTKFYEMGNNILISEFNALEEHQSYPGVLHGGIAAAILDETLGRSIMCADKELWGVTIELNLKYRKPLPTGEKLYARARLTEIHSRYFKAEGEIILPDGKPAVTASGKFMRLPLSQITGGGKLEEEWFYIEDSAPVNLPDYILP